MSTNQTADRIQRVDIIEQTWYGIGQKLKSIFSKNSGITGRDIEVIDTLDPDSWEYMQEQKGDQKFDLPVILVAPAQVDPDLESYNRNELRQRGYTLGICSDRVNYLMLKMSPTVLTCRVDLVSDDVVTTMRMVSRWSSNELWGFELKWSDWQAKIQVHAEKSLQIPPRVLTTGGSRQFKLTTTVRAKTYAGYVYKIPAIRRAEVEAKIANAATVEEAMADPNILSQTFSVQTFPQPGTDAVQFIPTV
jgi:hypothetical protein